jgi:hypothetical protein
MSANTPNDTVPQVLTEIQGGDGLSLSAAGRMFPAHRGEGTINPSTVFRWVTQGTKTADGRVVKLEAVRVPGRWLTSRSALARFVQALTAGADPAAAAALQPTTRTQTARRKSSERAARELERRGA